MEVPIPSAEQQQASQDFDRLLWSMSRPGTPIDLGANGDDSQFDVYLRIATALLDREVSFYANATELTHRIAALGARPVARNAADYLFLDNMDENALTDIQHAKRGSLLYPDTSATLILPTKRFPNRSIELRGPGIQSSISVSYLPQCDGFFEVRAQAIEYPLGWDAFFVSGAVCIGVPRTARASLS